MKTIINHPVTHFTVSILLFLLFSLLGIRSNDNILLVINLAVGVYLLFLAFINLFNKSILLNSNFFVVNYSLITPLLVYNFSIFLFDFQLYSSTYSLPFLITTSIPILITFGLYVMLLLAYFKDHSINASYFGKKMNQVVVYLGSIVNLILFIWLIYGLLSNQIVKNNLWNVELYDQEISQVLEGEDKLQNPFGKIINYKFVLKNGQEVTIPLTERVLMEVQSMILHATRISKRSNSYSFTLESDQQDCSFTLF